MKISTFLKLQFWLAGINGISELRSRSRTGPSHDRDQEPKSGLGSWYIQTFSILKGLLWISKTKAKNSGTFCVISLPGIDSCPVETGHDPGPTGGEGHGQPDGDVVRGRVPLVLSRKQRIYFLTDQGEYLLRFCLIIRPPFRDLVTHDLWKERPMLKNTQSF